MFYLNVLLCVLAIVFVFWMAWLIFRRNRTVECKGRDEYLSYAIIIILLVTLFPISKDEEYMVISAVRNIFLYLAFFSSLLPSRGISEKGMVMALFTIPWSQITDLRVEEYMTNKLQVVFVAYGMKHKLIYNRARTREVIHALQKYVGDVYMSKELDPYLKLKKQR